jgi:zinc transporter 7
MLHHRLGLLAVVALFALFLVSRAQGDHETDDGEVDPAIESLTEEIFLQVQQERQEASTSFTETFDVWLLTATRWLKDSALPSLVREGRTLALDWIKANDPVTTAMVSAGFIVVGPTLLLALLPSSMPRWLLSPLTGFGVGTLLGDLMTHVLPSAFLTSTLGSHALNEEFEQALHEDHEHHGHHHGHAHGDGSVGMVILAGMATFMLLDKFLRALTGGHHHHHHHPDEHDHHHHNHQEVSSSSAVKSSVSGDSLRQRNKNSSNDKPSSSSSSSSSHAHTEHHHHHHGSRRTFGVLTVLATMSHTLTDGLSLGMAHFASPAMAFSTTVAILVHEIPHKLGDYAILLNSGISSGKAFMMQLTMSLGTVCGTALSIWMRFATRTDSAATPWEDMVVPFTAGGLLYTATVGILSEIVETSGFFEFLLQLIFMGFGVLTMYLIAAFE